MRDFNGTDIFEAVRLENNEETLWLSVGIEVIVWTDNTDFESEYSGEITRVSCDGIEVEYLDFIPWEYITSLEIQTKITKELED